MQYFSKLSEKGINKEVSLKEILDAPTPVVEDVNKEYSVIKLRKYTENMLKNMEKTEFLLHKNSKEYNAMKAALEDLYEISSKNERNYINGRGIDSFGIGSKIEALQTVAMKYAETKGVGEQYSKRGQARMYAALDMCAEMSDFMNEFASKERMKDKIAGLK